MDKILVVFIVLSIYVTASLVMKVISLEKNSIPYCEWDLEWVCTNYSYYINQPVNCRPFGEGKVVCGNIIIEDKKECVVKDLKCVR